MPFPSSLKLSTLSLCKSNSKRCYIKQSHAASRAKQRLHLLFCFRDDQSNNWRYRLRFSSKNTCSKFPEAKIIAAVSVSLSQTSSFKCTTERSVTSKHIIVVHDSITFLIGRTPTISVPVCDAGANSASFFAGIANSKRNIKDSKHLVHAVVEESERDTDWNGLSADLKNAHVWCVLTLWHSGKCIQHAVWCCAK